MKGVQEKLCIGVAVGKSRQLVGPSLVVQVLLLLVVLLSSR